MQPQRMCHEKEVSEFHLCAGLHSLDRRSVQATHVGKGFLRHVLVQPSHADTVADGAAGIEDPLGLIGWHALNRLPTMIISQQQFCSIL